MAKRFTFNFSSKPAYTPVEKKGEINELRAQLSHADTEKDQAKKRDCLKKVIAYMTVGIDTSPLFTEMIMACATKDLVQKKMVYLYLCTHAETNPEIAILAINQLQKDFQDESPLVRGLALRSISSLRIPSMVEHLVVLLKNALTDSSPYVRKTAIIASCKLWRMCPEQFDNMAILDKLQTMIKDQDPYVCCNALLVANEVMEAEGGIQMTKNIAVSLLNKLKNLNEWQQCLVLELVLKYTPADEDEMFKIMNLLEERLWGSNSAVILAATHLFLTITQNLPQLHRQVYNRLKEPLLTLIATAPMETAYTCLCHIKLLISREPEVFADNFKDFYCRYNDPSFVKSLKLEILIQIANEKNYNEILTELAAYVTDVQVDTGRRAIRAMGDIALKTNAGQVAVDHFLEFLDMDMGFVRNETLSVLKDFLRKYTDITLIEPFFPAIVKNWKEMDDTPSKVAFVWILGEFGEYIEDAPYILEIYCERFKEEPPQVRLELLTACMKLFFKRPPELRPILGPLLHEAISDFSHADVHDRALLYYRLLMKNPKVAAQVVCCRKVPVEHFDNNESAEVKDKLFEEFNSLSVIFNMPAERFVVAYTGMEEEEEEEEEEDEESEEETEEEEESSDCEEAQVGLLHQPAHKKHTHSQPRPLQLDVGSTTDSGSYEANWKSLEVTANAEILLKPGSNAQQLQQTLASHSIQCLASGAGPNGQTKFYFFASAGGQGIYSECVLEATGRFTVLIKSRVPQHGPQFHAFLRNVLYVFAA